MLKPVLTLWRHASKSWRPSPHRRRPELLFASNSSKALECLDSELDIAWPLRDLWPVLSLVQGSERCLLIARSAMSRLIVHCVFHAVTILSCFFAWYSWIFLVHVRRLQLIRARWFLLESMKQRLCRVAWAGCFHGADHRFRIWVQWVPWSYKGRKVSPKYASRSKVWWIAKISAPKKLIGDNLVTYVQWSQTSSANFSSRCSLLPSTNISSFRTCGQRSFAFKLRAESTAAGLQT